MTQRARGGRGASTSGIGRVAEALGISRNELAAFTALKKEPPPLYPVRVYKHRITSKIRL